MFFQIPYDVKLYQSHYDDKKPSITSTGHVDWEIDDEEMEILEKEKGKPDGKYTKWFRESVTDYLKEFMTDQLEKKERIGKYALPISSQIAMFVLVTPTEVTLKGTPATWRKKKETIYFTGKVDFCVTAAM